MFHEFGGHFFLRLAGWSNFGRLLVGWIDASDIESRRILRLFFRDQTSPRFPLLFSFKERKNVLKCFLSHSDIFPASLRQADA